VASSARWICNRIRKWALSVRTCIRACTGRAKRYHGCRCAPDAAVCHGVERSSSRIRILVRVWTGMRPGCPGAVHSVTGEDKPSRETKVLYWNAVATLFRPLAEACKDSSDDEDDGSGLEDSSCIYNCECSAGFPGCSWSCQCPCGYGRDLNVYIHTYIIPARTECGKRDRIHWAMCHSATVT
jgi:hypothetical protein